MPLLRLARSTDGCLTGHVVQLEVLRICLFSLDKRSNEEAKLAVDTGWLGRQQVVVEGASLHDTLARFRRDPQPERLAKDVRLELAAMDVWLLRLNPVLHRETSLLALVVSLAMEQTEMVALTLGRSRRFEHFAGTRRKVHLLLGCEHADPRVHVNMVKRLHLNGSHGQQGRLLECIGQHGLLSAYVLAKRSRQVSQHFVLL